MSISPVSAATAASAGPSSASAAGSSAAAAHPSFARVLEKISLGEMLSGVVRPTTPPPPAAPSAAASTATASVAPGGIVRPADGRITSRFGMRTHPISGTRKLHAGTDIGAPSGSPVRAARPGTVTFAGNRGGYGLTVIVDHGGGLETLYAHQRSLNVRTGQKVGAGDLLGAVGSTGASTGPHLHFEVRRNGRPVEPGSIGFKL